MPWLFSRNKDKEGRQKEAADIGQLRQELALRRGRGALSDGSARQRDLSAPTAKLGESYARDYQTPYRTLRRNSSADAPVLSDHRPSGPVVRQKMDFDITPAGMEVRGRDGAAVRLNSRGLDFKSKGGQVVSLRSNDASKRGQGCDHCCQMDNYYHEGGCCMYGGHSCTADCYPYQCTGPQYSNYNCPNVHCGYSQMQPCMNSTPALAAPVLTHQTQMVPVVTDQLTNYPVHTQTVHNMPVTTTQMTRYGMPYSNPQMNSMTGTMPYGGSHPQAPMMMQNVGGVPVVVPVNPMRYR